MFEKREMVFIFNKTNKKYKLINKKILLTLIKYYMEIDFLNINKK